MRAAEVEEQLRSANLMYREPALYDEAMRDDDPVEAIVDQMKQFGPDADTVLDVGCGTGRTLRALCDTHGLTGVGVDVQRDLLAHAGRHPRCQWIAADARTARLDEPFDVILCLGNTAAYMHTPASWPSSTRRSPRTRIPGRCC
jgi:trans-aconitate methyltransferase